MVNYGNSMIYKLCCKNTDITDIYVGSTTNFDRRKAQHKSNCNNENREGYNIYLYQFIRANGGFQNWDMILIENVNVDNKRDLEKIERKFIDELKPSLNTTTPYRTKDERKEYEKEHSKKYRKENKTKIKEKRKIYYEEHKTELLEQKKEYHKENKEKKDEKKEQRKGYNKKTYEKNKTQILEQKKEYYENNKTELKEKNKKYHEKNKTELNEKKKEYREENKEKILEKQKEYYENNKTEINEKRKEKIECEFCNCFVRKDSIKRHQDTPKCKELRENKN